MAVVMLYACHRTSRVSGWVKSGRDVSLIEIEGDGVLHKTLRGFPIARQLYVQVGGSLA